MEFADIAFAFMVGIPGWGSSGFRMMGPDELRRQRWTYVKYWLRKRTKLLKEVEKSLSE